MGYSDYTAPIFGTIDMGQYYVPSIDEKYYLKVRNRPEIIIKNDDGTIRKADILITKTYHEINGSQRLDVFNEENQKTFEVQSKGCILAVKRNYGNFHNTALGQTYEIMGGVIGAFKEMYAYDYIFVTEGKQLTATSNNYNSGTLCYGTRRHDSLKLGIPTLIGALPPVNDRIIASQGYRTGGGATLDRLTRLVSDMQRRNREAKENSAFPDLDVYENDMILQMTALNAEWASRPDSVYRNIYINISSSWGFYLYNETDMAVGSTIATGFPIFTTDNYSQMIRYFQGQSYVSDNDPTPPPSDWSTDWDVWVRGANKPNLYVTMKSDKVDEWLASEDNKSGIKKSDIKVTYRYAKVDGVDVDLNVDTSQHTFKTMSYDDALQTSYEEIIRAIFDDYYPDDLNILMGMYARLEFRISYAKYNSTWCYFSVGVIGSPSVPDFSEMKNSCGQTDYGFNDSSTVTLHYDEYPPGYDPYPTPSKPSDPSIIGGDTLPSTPTDSDLGLGLLTTTYLLTASQAEELGNFIWNFDLFEKIKALNTSPLDNIVSLKIIPYAVSGSPAEIVIGNVSTQINADKIGALPLLKVGELEYQGRYQNFLDVTGDTTAHLFLPFIGFVPIDPIWFTNKKLEVYYAFDAITGTCRAIIAVDNISVANYTSACGIDIPMSMGSRAQQEAAYVGASLGIMIATAGAPTAGLTTAVGSIASVAFGDNKNQRTGGVSPMTAQYETRMCYVVIESTNANYPRSTAHDFGLPCNSTYSLAQLNGFTQTCDNPDLSGIGCSEEEKEMIRRLLTSGVYL